MKARIIPSVYIIVLAILSVCSAEDIFSDWAYAENDGSVAVILHVKTGEGKYAEVQLEPGKVIVLPAGSQKVTAFPVKGQLEKSDRMSVRTGLFAESHKGKEGKITEPGKSVKFSRPSIAVTPEMRKSIKDEVIFAPGALAPAEEAKEGGKKEEPIDDRESLREQNRMYIEKNKRLEEIDPKGAEAERISGALRIWEKDINGKIKEAEAKYGPDWRENYRDSSGKLPGGFIEDDKSRLVKLQERRKEQQNKVDGLKSEFEELKKRLKAVGHGAKKQSEKDKAEQADINKAIGSKMKEISKEQAELNSLDKEAAELEARQKAKDARQPAKGAEKETGEKTGIEEDAEKEKEDEDVSSAAAEGGQTASTGQPAREIPKDESQKVSDEPKNGRWNGWGGITILDGDGTYKDTYGTGPGQFTFWRNEKGHFSGTWEESERRFGVFDFECDKDGTEIRGSWKASNECSIEPGNGGDIYWTFEGPGPEAYGGEQFAVKVITVTADSELAEMDGGLAAYIIINGQETLKQELNDPEDDFEPGATDEFERIFDIPLSEVKSVSVVVEGDDEWLCEQISFQFFTEDKISKTYNFSINTWFSGDADDMKKLGAVKSKSFNINPSAEGLTGK